MRCLLFLVAVVSLAGCDSTGSASQLELVVSRTRFTAGDVVAVALDNDTGRTQEFSPCLAILSADSYQPVDGGAVCASIAATIRSGQTVPLSVQIPADLTAGAYRIGLSSGPMEPGGRLAVVTGRFEVVSAE